MIYLISGASRAGKTLIAKKMSIEKGISYLSLDWLVMGFTKGIPEYGLHDMLFPDDIARRFWPFLKAMLENMLYEDVDYIIEGEAMLPELLIDLLKQHPNKITACFLGFTEVEVHKKVMEVKNHQILENDWLLEKSVEYIEDHIKNMIAHSVMIKKSCEDNNVVYFDTSKNFDTTINKAINYLLDN